MKKSISNIQEIKDSVSKLKLPEQFKLSDAEIINDVGMFINNSLSLLSTDKLTRFHRPYYDRLKKVLDSFKIEIKIQEKK